MCLIHFRCCQLLSMTLNSIGIENVCLHGFMRQRERVAALNKFKSNHVRTLIATDVASRGLDISSVQLVINHRLPKIANEYIHRYASTLHSNLLNFQLLNQISFLQSWTNSTCRSSWHGYFNLSFSTRFGFLIVH